MNDKDQEKFRELFFECFEPFATSIQQTFMQIDERIEHLEARVDKGFAEIKAELTDHKVWLQRLSRRMDNLDLAVADLRTDVRGLREDMREVKQRLARIEERQAEIVTRKEWRQLEVRVTRLEAQVAALQAA